MAMRIAPSANYPTHTSNTSKNSATPQPSQGAPSAPGVPDSLRASLSPAVQQSSGPETPVSTHPLEARLKQWRQTQDAMKMENLRRVYGIAEPVRRQMELKLVRDGEWRPAALRGGNPGPSIHEDILAIGGRETDVTWDDVFHGEELREPPSFHDEMETRLKMNR